MLLAFTVGSLVQWQQGHVKGAVAAGVLVVAGARRGPVLRSRGALGPAGRGACGWRWRRSRARRRASRPATASSATTSSTATRTPAQAQDLADALRWARDVRDARIAVAGIRGVFTQYPFYGTDLSNQVQWLGVRGPHDAYQRIPNCRAVAARRSTPAATPTS